MERPHGQFRVASAILSALVFLTGCHGNPPPPAALLPAATTPDPTTNWVQVLRQLDDSGLLRNDQRTLTSVDDIAKLKAWFPEMDTSTQSNVHGGWQAFIVLHFHTASGIDTYVSSDYRLYRIYDGARGDFVVPPGFADYVQHMFLPTSANGSQ